MWVPLGWQCRWLHLQGWLERGPVWCLRVVQNNAWHVTNGVPSKSHRCMHGAIRDSVLLPCSDTLPSTVPPRLLMACVLGGLAFTGTRACTAV
jgi:hypothetical protein